MDQLHAWVDTAVGYVWGWPFMVLLVGTGLFLTIRLRGLQFRKLLPALWMARPGGSKTDDSPGDISNFQALMTALSATVGTGNIAGVATAISLGGPGALFWMWVVGLVGMATKYCEAVLAVHYRITDEHGRVAGGPMYYISRGLKMKRLAAMFAVFTVISATLGIGCPIQSNSIAHALESTFDLAPWITGLILMVATGAVLIGGIQSIGKVAGVLVPTMIVFYMAAAISILVMRAADLPAAFSLVFREAFTGSAAVGGFAGSTIMMAVRLGVARGLFSNESGLGSAAIAAAAAKTDHPVQQALVSMTQTFIDTLVVCTLTGMVLIVTGVWSSGETGAALTTHAFEAGFSGGHYVVSIGLLLFAWSTILGWSYYGERALVYLFGDRATPWYRVVFVLFVGLGAIAKIEIVWGVGDICNALMAFPNLIALILLSPVIVKLTKEYFATR